MHKWSRAREIRLKLRRNRLSRAIRNSRNNLRQFLPTQSNADCRLAQNSLNVSDSIKLINSNMYLPRTCVAMWYHWKYRTRKHARVDFYRWIHGKTNDKQNRNKKFYSCVCVDNPFPTGKPKTRIIFKTKRTTTIVPCRGTISVSKRFSFNSP